MCQTGPMTSEESEGVGPPETPGPPGPQARLRLPRLKRLARSRDFARVYREGNRARGKLMTVAVVDNGLEVTRMGLSVGRSVWRRAVQRNRVRRLFREAFRLSYPELPVGLDLVMIGSVPRVEPELEATRRELVALARKACERHRAPDRQPRSGGPERREPARKGGKRKAGRAGGGR